MEMALPAKELQIFWPDEHHYDATYLRPAPAHGHFSDLKQNIPFLFQGVFQDVRNYQSEFEPVHIQDIRKVLTDSF